MQSAEHVLKGPTGSRIICFSLRRIVGECLKAAARLQMLDARSYANIAARFPLPRHEKMPFFLPILSSTVKKRVKSSEKIIEARNERRRR